MFATSGVAMILQVLIAMIAGWINRHQQQVIAYRYLEGTGISLKHNGVLFLRTTRVRFTAMWYHRGGGLLGEE
jgi:hypothetical protein